MRWYVLVILVGDSLISNDVEHLFIYLLANSMSMRKCVFRFIAQFFNWIIWHFAIELYEFLVYFGY